MEEINSKITLVDDTVIFKAGQTTESESLTLKFEGELPEFINLVSPDLMVDLWDPPYGSAPSSLVHTFGAELTRIYHGNVSVWKAPDEPSASFVEFEFGAGGGFSPIPDVIPDEDMVLTYELASYIHSGNFQELYMAVVEDAGYEYSGYSTSSGIYDASGHVSEDCL